MTLFPRPLFVIFTNRSFATPVGLAVVLGLLIITAPSAQAQLAQTIWAESLSLTAGVESGGGSGSDNSMPEPLSDSILGPQGGDDYSISGSVAFSPVPSFPQTTCTISTNYNSGDITSLTGNAFSSIIFRFVVVQTSSGGPGVSQVPVSVQAAGTAEVTADGGTFAAAGSSFIVRMDEGGQALIFEQIIANTGGGGTPTSDSFLVSSQLMVPPGAVLQGDMQANANSTASFNQGSTSGTATGFVDPVIEVADELIPGGGGASYRDFYEIEFSDGYLALGDPTPVEPTTWGRIKRLYAN